MKGVTDMLGKSDIDLHDLFDGKKIKPEIVNNFINRIIKSSHEIKSDKYAQQRAQQIANNGFLSLTEYINKEA